MKNIFKIFSVALLGAALSGCLKDQIDGPSKGGDTKANEEISILLSVPGADAPSSRSMDGAAENAVTDIDVLVFKVSGTTETFAYYQKGTYVTNVLPGSAGDPYKTKFKVNLMVEADRKIVVVANARAVIDNLFDGNAGNGEITAGMGKTAVLEQLTLAAAAKWNAAAAGYTPIPMYGELTGAVNIKPGDNFNMALTRMLARVDVHNATGSNFKVNKVHLAKPMAQGYIAPVWDADGKTFQGAATAPNIKGAWTNTTGSLIYDMSAVTTGATGMQQSYGGEIYTFETRAASGDGDSDAARLGATCLVLEGVYDGAAYFYRVDFTYDGTNGTTKGAYMPLLRNYKYEVIVDAAEGIGYASYNEALNSYTVPSNLRTRIIHYDESVITNVVSDGQYMLGVEMTEMKIDWTGMPVTNFIVTDYDYTYSADTAIDPVQHENGWRITGYSKDGLTVSQTTKPDWFFAAAQKETLNATKCNLKVCASMYVDISNVNGDINYSTPAERTPWYIHIQAGRLRQVIKVTQSRHTQLINMPRQYPNSYMVQPGGTLLIPTLKPWLMWHAPMSAGGVGEALHPCDAVTCELVWQDTQNLISELALAGGDQGAHSQLYVRATPGKSGNAVVAVKVGGVIVWSWHIWVSTYVPGDGVGTKKLMDRNLGALNNKWTNFTTPVTPAKLTDNVVGMHYQWGRKDPFPTKSTYENSITTVSSDLSLKRAIANPLTFMEGWIDVVNLNSWNTGTTAAPKTVFDPCPSGWRVPDTGTFGISTTAQNLAGAAWGNWGAFLNGGRIFDTGFFPTSGARGVTPPATDAQIVSGSANDYGSGRWYMNDYKNMTTIFQFQIIELNAATSSGASAVRCVKDEKTNSMKDITADPVPAGYTFYVGAFWKADQIGERLIKMGAPAGDWTATVIEGADWVKLDQRDSEDPNINTNSAADMITYDRTYQVSGTTATTVTGTIEAGEEIYFRIGLKSTLASATTAPRYGVVLLTYENNTKYHKIYLRQGEEADYLMRPQDSNGAGTITTQWGGTAANPRPVARKFSPYNLSNP